MKQRIVVGLLALPLIVVPIWLGGVWMALMVVATCTVGGLEYYHLMQVGGFRSNQVLGTIWLAALVLTGWRPDLFPLSLILMAGMIATLVDALPRIPNPINHWMVTALVALYVGIMGGQVLAVRGLPDGLWWMLFGFVVTWGNDTVAYFVGVTVGRHKLWPRISPKKSWEGTVAGWVGAALIGAGWVALTPLAAHYSLLFGLVLGALCGVLALLGDLSISILKRQVGVKDSGRFFPGHGGMLDRMDSLLFVLPFVYQVIRFWL